MPVRAYDVRPKQVRVPAYAQSTLLLLLVVGACSLFTVNIVIPWLTIKHDDYVYGRPRKTYLAVDVNPTDRTTLLSQFIAINLDRQIAVLYIPDDDVEQTQTLKGPYLFGAGADLTPVKLRTALVNKDPFPDLIVSVNDEEIIYITENGKFRLISEAERTAYVP